VGLIKTKKKTKTEKKAPLNERGGAHNPLRVRVHTTPVRLCYYSSCGCGDSIGNEKRGNKHRKKRCKRLMGLFGEGGGKEAWQRGGYPRSDIFSWRKG